MFTKSLNAQNGRHESEIVIEGKPFLWPEEYITGAEVKGLARLPMDSELFLSVEPPFKDELVANGDKVNVARMELEHFYIKKKLDYSINGQPFESFSQFISGKQLRRQGGIAPDDQVFLFIPGPWQDELIKDDEFVNLAREGRERFYSIHQLKEFIIIVRGREQVWKEKTISYSQVVELAFGKLAYNPDKVYTVSYKHGPHENPEGTMVDGDDVFVKNKMIFNVTETDKS